MHLGAGRETLEDIEGLRGPSVAIERNDNEESDDGDVDGNDFPRTR